MAVLRPFKAFRPQPQFAEKVACVPYDVINTTEAAALAEGNPLSFLHVVRSEIDLPVDVSPYDEQVYRRAKENFSQLVRDGILVQEKDPCLFAYRLTRNGRSQTGLVGCSSVDEYDSGTIRIHELTRPDKEDDRLRHILTLRGQAEPVFLAYQSNSQTKEVIRNATAKAPLFDFIASDGVGHTLWKIEDTEAAVSAYAALPVTYIADGHHRSKSASRARQELRSSNSDSQTAQNFFLSVSFPHDELEILPYNRILRASLGISAKDVLERLTRVVKLQTATSPEPAVPGEVCVNLDGQWLSFSLPLESREAEDPVLSLDVARLQNHILAPLFGVQDPRTDKNIDFVGGIRGTSELDQLVSSGAAIAAFSMFPVTIEQLFAVADAGLLMPPKSTWFEPKLRSGLFIHMFS